MRFLSGRGLAGLGWGLPAAIGAKFAAPERTVVCLAGDGGFAHMWCELESAKRLGVKVVLIVLNNQILAYQWHAEDVFYGGHTDAVQLAPVDHAAIARACGCEGIRVEQADDFQGALDRALKAPVTTVDRRADRSEGLSADHDVRRQDGRLNRPRRDDAMGDAGTSEA